MVTYVGWRNERGKAEVCRLDGGDVRRLDPRFDLWRHSPDGFEWGYQGSGPAQLALALLADALGDDSLAVLFYQSFKRHVVANLAGDFWTLEREAVKDGVLVACSNMLEDVVSLDDGQGGDPHAN